jgi:ankyrin repeat protein
MLLTEAQAMIDIANDNGNTAVHLATIAGHLTVLKWLVTLHKRIKQRNNLDRGRQLTKSSELSEDDDTDDSNDDDSDFDYDDGDNPMLLEENKEGKGVLLLAAEHGELSL